MTQNRLVNILLALALILLAGTGYESLSNHFALGKLDQALSGLEVNLEQPTATQVSQSVGLSEAELLAAAATTQPGVSSETPAPTATPQEKTIQVIFPAQGGSLAIDYSSPSVTVRLQNSTSSAQKVTARLLLVQSAAPGNSLWLSPGVRSQEATLDELLPDQASNLTLEFTPSTLPASGAYQGWLLISADDLPPVAQQVSILVTRPVFAFQNRLSGEQNANILLGGIRTWPRLTLHPLRLQWDVAWNPYTLRMWEANLQPAPFTLLPSELTDPQTGLTGLLTAQRSASETDPLQPVSVLLKPAGIHWPGSYTGALSIYSPDGLSSQTLKITAQVRDDLAWPFLTIVIGALVAGWLLRFGARAIKDSLPYQRLTIELARRRLHAVPYYLTNPQALPCVQIEQRLQLAELGLNIGDLAQASAEVSQANLAIQRLESGAQQIQEAEKRLANLRQSYTSFPKDQVEEKLKNAQTLLDQAGISLRSGLLDQMESSLKALPAALEQAALDLEALKKPITKAGTPGHIHYNDQIYHPGQVPRLKTGEPIQFSVVKGDAPVTEPLDWELRRLQMLPAQPPQLFQGATFDFQNLPDPLELYPHRYRVSARSPQGLAAEMDFEIDHPYHVHIVPHDPAYVKENVNFMLEPGNIPQDVSWSLYLPDSQTPQPLASLPYRLESAGRYHVAAMQALRCIASTRFKAVKNPLDQQVKTYRRTAWVASIGWALAAGVAGMVYISARLPTFGSPLDYLLALAWGLGVGTTVAPKEGLVAGLQKALGLSTPTTPTPAPPADSGGQPNITPPTNPQGQGHEPPSEVVTTPPPAQKLKVPPLAKLTYAEAEAAAGGNFKLAPRQGEATADWMVIQTEPDAGAELEKGGTIYLNLVKP